MTPTMIRSTFIPLRKRDFDYQIMVTTITSAGGEEHYFQIYEIRPNDTTYLRHSEWFSHKDKAVKHYEFFLENFKDDSV